MWEHRLRIRDLRVYGVILCYITRLIAKLSWLIELPINQPEGVPQEVKHGSKYGLGCRAQIPSCGLYYVVGTTFWKRNQPVSWGYTICGWRSTESGGASGCHFMSHRCTVGKSKLKSGFCLSIFPHCQASVNQRGVESPFALPELVEVCWSIPFDGFWAI